ncbi:MAG TPA: 3'(2'),5'-bisphosphate nucleotidase CysQ [Pseudolabrys sp.]|nr:3'(2'),5'-bisphosphate nucleotidase CysQ [Pseudolabrys sp.]
MPGNDLSALRPKLESILREAGALAIATSRSAFRHWTKGADRSPVSEADIAVNDFLRSRLTDLVSDAVWISEETEAIPEEPFSSAWIVDPIDGTRAFISGRTDWSISVALAERDRPTVAALFAPASGEMFLASRGGGATLNDAPLRAKDDDALGGVRIAGPKRHLDQFSKVIPGFIAQAKVHSLALRLARVAQGSVDASFASQGSRSWDLAAADLLVHEAGGVLTDFTGEPLKYHSPQRVFGALVAAGRRRHHSLLTLVRGRAAEFA